VEVDQCNDVMYPDKEFY